MRLLLTRAEPGAGTSAERLQRLGHEVLVEPMLSIELLPAPADLPAPTALVLTSANGARAIAAWSEAKRWRELPVFVIGSRTAEAVRAAGFRRVRSANGNADALFALIERELDPNSGIVLYAVAEITATHLQGRLTRHGYSVRRVSAYRAVPAPKFGEAARAAMAGAALDAALFYSERAAANFAALIKAAGLEADLGTIDLIALSDDVARPLRSLSPKRLLVAVRPDEEALFSCLE
jgi:uroporphyrinogen-III synthase